MSQNAVPDPPGINGVKSVRGQKGKGFFASHGCVAESGIFKLFFAANVMQKTGGDQDIVIYAAFRPGNLKRVIQDAVDVFPVVGAVIHAGEHVVFQ